jgi:hypothetical protein
MDKSKNFAKGQTILPEAVRDALSAEAGVILRYAISAGTVQVLKSRSVTELAGMLARNSQAAIFLEKMGAAVAQGAVENTK